METLAVVILWLQQLQCSTASSPKNGLILQVRRFDASIDRIVVPSGMEQTKTIEQLLSLALILRHPPLQMKRKATNNKNNETILAATPPFCLFLLHHRSTFVW